MCNKWKGNKIIDTADAADATMSRAKNINWKLRMLQASRSVENIKDSPSEHRTMRC